MCHNRALGDEIFSNMCSKRVFALRVGGREMLPNFSLTYNNNNNRGTVPNTLVPDVSNNREMVPKKFFPWQECVITGKWFRNFFVMRALMGRCFPTILIRAITRKRGAKTFLMCLMMRGVRVFAKKVKLSKHERLRMKVWVGGEEGSTEWRAASD